MDDEEEDDRDADTAPGLNVGSLPAPPGANAQPFSDPPPPIPSTPPDRAPLPPAQSTGPQLQLVLARTSLPDTPSVMLAPPAEAPSREEPRRALTSIFVFAAMLCAAAVPLARYALKSSAEEPPVATHAAMQRVQPRATSNAAPAPAAAAPNQDAKGPSALAAPAAEPERVDRLPEIMAGLPAEASEACEYLVDHAVRARDSNELQLAETLLGRASELDDRNPHPAFALAQLRFEQGNYEGAEGWIANAIRLRPRRAEYRTLYANILSRLGREGEARDERRRAQRFKD